LNASRPDIWRQRIAWTSVPADGAGVSLSPWLALPVDDPRAGTIGAWRRVTVAICGIDPGAAPTAPPGIAILAEIEAAGVAGLVEIARGPGGYVGPVDIPATATRIAGVLSGLDPGTSVRWYLSGVIRPELTEEALTRAITPRDARAWPP